MDAPPKKARKETKRKSSKLEVMALGTFSGGGLGMGISFFLEDFFSSTADEIEKKMDSLGANTEVMAQKIENSLNQIKLGGALTAIGGLILAPFVKGVEHASDYSENINKLEVAFGDYADKVRDFTDNVALDKVGIGKNEASEMASLFGDMATGMGISQKAGADMSIQLTQLAGDLKSFKNLKGDRAQDVLKSIFTGETESLKGIGVVMTKTNLEAFAMSKGINKSFKDMTEPEKVMLRMDYVMNATKNSLNDFANTGDSYANQQRKMQGAIGNLMITLGQTIEPIMAKIYGVIGSVIKKFDELAQSPLGRFILGLTATIGTLLVVIGTGLVVMGSLRFALFKTAWAFGGATKAALLTTFANGGLTASFTALGVAIWTALAPLLPIIIAIALALGLVYLAVKYVSQGFSDLDKWDGEKSLGGVRTLFMGIASVIESVGQIWNSFNGETFTLTEELASKLESMGLLDFVIELGTWIARLKTIFDGVVDGFSKGFEALKRHFKNLTKSLVEPMNSIKSSFGKIFNSIKKALSPLTRIFNSLTDGLFKSKGELTTWQKVANVISNTIGVAFEIIGFVITTVIEILAWLIAGFVELVAIVIEVVASIIDAFMWLYDGFSEAVDYIIDIVLSVGSAMYDAGAGLLESLWEGFKSMFPGFAGWLEGAVTALVDSVIGAFTWIWDKAGEAIDWATGTDEDGNVTNLSEGDSPILDGLEEEEEGSTGTLKRLPITPVVGPSSTAHENSTKSPTIINNNTSNNDNTSSDSGTTVVQMVLDGDVISEKVISAIELKNDRG